MLRSTRMRVARGAILALVFVVAPARAEDQPVELYETVATTTPRADITKFLVARAERAAKARDWAHAIPFYQAIVVANGWGSADGKTLATLWTLAGQNDEAAAAWTSYSRTVSDKVERADSLEQAQRLASAPHPVAGQLALAVLEPEAKQAFSLGRAAFKKQQFGDALVYFHVGYA